MSTKRPTLFGLGISDGYTYDGEHIHAQPWIVAPVYYQHGIVTPVLQTPVPTELSS